MEVAVECLMSVVLIPMVELMSAANRIQALSLLLPEPTLHRPESDQTERIYLFERTVWPSIIQREQFTVLNASHPSVRCANIMAGPSFRRPYSHRPPSRHNGLLDTGHRTPDNHGLRPATKHHYGCPLTKDAPYYVKDRHQRHSFIIFAVNGLIQLQ